MDRYLSKILLDTANVALRLQQFFTKFMEDTDLKVSDILLGLAYRGV